MNKKISLIWSFRNRPATLFTSLYSADRTCPKDVDFVLVDAASEDINIRRIREFCSHSIEGRNIRVCESSYRSSLAEAWNWGMILTNNRYCIFASSDVLFMNGWWYDGIIDEINNGGQYVLVDNHAVFMLDKAVIPKMGWFDENFVPGPHFDCDAMIRASEAGIEVKHVSRQGSYNHGNSKEINERRGAEHMEDRLPMNGFENEDYFKQKWETDWEGWRNCKTKQDKPHPPTHIREVKRKIKEVDWHPFHTKRIEKAVQHIERMSYEKDHMVITRPPQKK